MTQYKQASRAVIAVAIGVGAVACASITKLGPKPSGSAAVRRTHERNVAQRDKALKLDDGTKCSTWKGAWDAWAGVESLAEEALRDSFCERNAGDDVCTAEKKLLAEAKDHHSELLASAAKAGSADLDLGCFPQRLHDAYFDKELGKRIAVDDEIPALAGRVVDHWKAIVNAKKSLRAEVKDTGEGLCVISAKATSSKTTDAKSLRAAFRKGDTDDIHIRCVLPKPASQYKRNQPDELVISMWNDGDFTGYKHTISIDPKAVGGDTVELAISPRSLIGILEKQYEKAASKGAHFSFEHRYYLFYATYKVSHITGKEEVRDADGNVTLKDVWKYELPASGFWFVDQQ